MKILFYLPVITPWWFDDKIVPMLRTLHGAAELHVMVAPLWRNTGIEAAQFASLADLDTIHWHIVDAEDPAPFRYDGAATPGLLDQIEAIAPDLTIARSADFATPALFPGTVRYIMESASPPFQTDRRWIVLEKRPFLHGIMDEGDAETATRCTHALLDLWHQTQDRLAQPRAPRWRSDFGLPQDRPILAVPLHYEHEENFFLTHCGFPRAVDLVRHLLKTVDDHIFLAITDHPLNQRHVDRTELHQLILEHAERAALCAFDGAPGDTTDILALHADAMLVDLSKSWSLAAHAGTPMVRIGQPNQAAWLNVTMLSDPRVRAWSDERLPPADPMAAQRYFCWHLGSRLFDPQDLTLARLLAHVSGQVDDAIIHANAEMLKVHQRKAA